MDEPQALPDAAPAPSVSPPRRRFRFSIGTMMLFVLTAASASAMAARLHHLLQGDERWAIDVPALGTLAISLTAVAIVSVRRGTLHQGMLQVALCCALVLATVGLIEADWTRALPYWFQTCFALIVALPLALRRTERPWSLWASEVLLGAFANLMLVLVGVFLQFLMLELI
jgi:hypothetical protein